VAVSAALFFANPRRGFDVAAVALGTAGFVFVEVVFFFAILWLF
jgi:hypothetical protein